MSLPYFYIDHALNTEIVTLPEESSRHMVQVLRMKTGEQLKITDGKGSLHHAEIINDNKKGVQLKIIERKYVERLGTKTAVAISLLKNAGRFEWFLEKATELGIDVIIPLICERTEKQHYRADRMKSIITSALIQSQQPWMPELMVPLRFTEAIESNGYEQKWIAHCEAGAEKKELTSALHVKNNRIIFIGPEGDFSLSEIQLSFAKGYEPVALGETRLRAETAGVVAATLIKLC
jgi:16S rRNA (uracil1498-N3)-methyltransferase